MRIALLVVTYSVTVASVAHACATCGCGDPTLTAMGVEKPFENRVRLGIEERFGGHTSGDPSYEEDSWTLRSTLVASWSPMSRLTLIGLVPLVNGWDRVAQGPWNNYTMLGDAELSIRGIVLEDRKWSPRHIVSLTGGLKIPTGPRAYDNTGYPVEDDLQPGTGSWDPFASVGYAWFGDDFSVFSSVGYRYTTPGRDSYVRGQSVGATAGLQFQPLGVLAFSVSLDFRWAAADQLPNNMGVSVAVPNTGGSGLALTPSIILAPFSNWLIKLSAQLHVADAYYGQQSEAHAVILSTVVDLR